jgi:hypothetical protein
VEIRDLVRGLRGRRTVLFSSHILTEVEAVCDRVVVIARGRIVQMAYQREPESIVWCAAGKGTFGTDELVKKIRSVRLASVVKHATVILPQLGAPGVAAHEVTRQTGFSVVYGPVRATDSPAFLRAGMQCTPAMRRVTLPMAERLALVPVELVQRLVPALGVWLFFLLLAALRQGGLDGLAGTCLRLTLGAGGVFLAGTVLVPALLPWLLLLTRAGLLLGAAMTHGLNAADGRRSRRAGFHLAGRSDELVSAIPSGQQFLRFIPREGLGHLDQGLELAYFQAQGVDFTQKPADQHFRSRCTGDSTQVNLCQVAHFKLFYNSGSVAQL